MGLVALGALTVILRTSAQRVEQCFGLNQVPGCETFGEASINFGE
jgi:hypothetical protein